MSRATQTRTRTFFPTAINVFRQCPERYYLKYIRKRKRPMPFSRPLACGGAAHRLIAAVLPDFMLNGEIPADLEQRALDEVSAAAYPAGELAYRKQDARDIAKWTLTAFEMIPPGSRSMLQERKLYAPLGRSSVQIGAQIDLVLRRDDGNIEHIDFKTGKVRDDAVQNLIARAVVGRKFGIQQPIRTTTLYLQHRRTQSTILDRRTSRREWESIARDIRDIRSLDDFPPRPGPLCVYCPYQARDCTAWCATEDFQREDADL